MPRLRLQGPHHAWSDTALAGLLGEEEARPVMVFLGPDPGGDRPSAQERAVAAPWIGREAPGLLPLWDILAHENRNARVFPRVEALGLVHLVDLPDAERPPIKIAAELVASVSQTLVALGPDGLRHPGPGPEHVGVDAAGRTWLTGFASPWPRTPLARDPAPSAPAEAAVWRLGVLLALLLSGRIPAVNERSGHDAMVRRILIRTLARSGPLFSPRYRDWLVGMLAWEPDQRPPLSAIGPGLREVAERIEGAPLSTWAEAQVPTRIRRVVEQMAEPVDPDVSYHPWNTDPDPSEDGSIPRLPPPSASGTLPGLPLSTLDGDEETAESTLVAGEVRGPGPVAEPGTMPVGIGPPVEALRHRPTLPRDFLEGPADGAPPARSPTDWIQLGLLVLLSLVLLGLLLLIGLVIYLGG